MDSTGLPKMDLHRHLDGNIRLETILDLAERHGIALPAHDAATLRPYVTVTEPTGNLVAFLEKFRYSIGVLADLEACRRVAYENVEDAFREGLDYVELRFSPWFMAQPHGLNAQGVTEAVLDGLAQGRRDFPVQVAAIGILSRTFGPEIAARELDALLACRAGLVALDLAGDEFQFPAALFVDHFARAREVGWQITIHAGEAAGASSIWEALRLLGATRIGHGVHAVEDPALLDYLGENRIGLECCPTSNVQTCAVPDLAHHPLRRFLEAGLLATINTDDPGISGIDLDHELLVAAPAAGLTPAQVEQARRNAPLLAFAWDATASRPRPD